MVQDNSWEVKKLNISFDHVLSDAVEIINQSFAIVALKCQKAVEELIEKYIHEGNDLNSEIEFKELRTNVDLIFKTKSIFSFFG